MRASCALLFPRFNDVTIDVLTFQRLTASTLPQRQSGWDSLQRVEAAVRAAEIDDAVCHEWRRKNRTDRKLPIGRDQRCFPPGIEEQKRHVESSLRGQDPVCVLL